MNPPQPCTIDLRRTGLGHQYRWVGTVASTNTKRGFTLLELLVVVGVIGVLVSLLLPAVQASREAARRMSCSNNIRQIALAAINYHSAFEQLPPHGTGTFTDANPAATTNQFRLSFLVSILPFIDQTPMWEAITDPDGGGGLASNFGQIQSYDDLMGSPEQLTGSETVKDQTRYPAMGPIPTEISYSPWQTEIAVYRCPSDPGAGYPAAGRTNYAVCLGDAIDGLDVGFYKHFGGNWVSNESQMRITGRGAFIPRHPLRLSDITDGLSTTLLFGEICTSLGDLDIRTAPSLANKTSLSGNAAEDFNLESQIDPVRPMFWRQQGSLAAKVSAASNPQSGRGYAWADMAPLQTGFNAIARPNSAVFLQAGVQSSGILPPSSRHPGGCNVAQADGSIRYITDSIDDGSSIKQPYSQQNFDPTAESHPSQFGLFGSLATRSGMEIIDSEF